MIYKTTKSLRFYELTTGWWLRWALSRSAIWFFDNH